MPKKNPNMLWKNDYRERILAEISAEKRKKNALKNQKYRARKRAEAAAAEDEFGPPVTKKARVESAEDNNDNTTGKDLTEINAGDTRGRRRKTATKNDKPAEVRTTRRTRAKDESCNGTEAFNDEITNGKEGKETEDNPDDILNPTSAVFPSGEDRTSRRRNKVDKSNKEPKRMKALIQTSQALEPDLARDTDDIVVIAADKASTSINLATGTESEGKISTEDTSTAQGHMDVEVEPQVIQSVSATSCLANQPLIVNVFNINENNVNQGGSGNSVFAPNTQSGPSTSNESVFFGVEPTMGSQEYPGFGAIQQGYGASGSYEQAVGWTAQNNVNQRGYGNSLTAPTIISGLSISNEMTQRHQHPGTSTAQTSIIDDTQNSTSQSQTLMALDATDDTDIE